MRLLPYFRDLFKYAFGDKSVIGVCDSGGFARDRQIFGLDGRWTRFAPGFSTPSNFRPNRCMFASHMSFAKLACSFQNLYCAYPDGVADFSASEKRKLFPYTAIMIYGLTSPNG
jgi:hypothetical protein